MLRRRDIDHILRAAASLSGHARFVMVGTGAVIATARNIPVGMMLTEEIDIYVEDAADPDLVSDLIDASIGRYSQFHRTSATTATASVRAPPYAVGLAQPRGPVRHAGWPRDCDLPQCGGHRHRQTLCLAREGPRAAA